VSSAKLKGRASRALFTSVTNISRKLAFSGHDEVLAATTISQLYIVSPAAFMGAYAKILGVNIGAILKSIRLLNERSFIVNLIFRQSKYIHSYDFIYD
jgi:hypothetical protein